MLTAAFVHVLPQMAVLEIQSNGDSSYVSQEAINSAIQSLEDPLQRVSADGEERVAPGAKPASRPVFGGFSRRSSSRSVWRWTPGRDPLLRSCSSIRPCLRCPY